MKHFTFAHFGDLDLNNLQEKYEINIDLHGTNIKIDLNFKEKTIDLNKASLIQNFISNIDNYNIQNKVLIQKSYDYQNDSVVKEYIEFHLEELDREILGEFIDFDNTNVNPAKQLLNQLKLVRVGLYPDGKYNSTNFAVYDYTIDRKITDQIIVINTDENNNLEEITWES